MKKTYCDRCGKETNVYPWQCVKFPHYTIVRLVSVLPNTSIELDLCNDCISEFKQWLESEVEK